MDNRNQVIDSMEYVSTVISNCFHTDLALRKPGAFKAHLRQLGGPRLQTSKGRLRPIQGFSIAPPNNLSVHQTRSKAFSRHL